MSKDKPHYFNIQEAVVENGIWAVMSDIDRRLYVPLCRYADWETRRCWPSVTQLCKVTGMCRGSVVKAAKHLTELGLLDVWYHRAKGERYAKKYYLIKPIDHLCPPAWTQVPVHTMDTSTRKRGKNGRFLKNKGKKGEGTGPHHGHKCQENPLVSTPWTTTGPHHGQPLVHGVDSNISQENISQENISQGENSLLKGEEKKELTLEEFQMSVEAWKGDEKRARDYWRKKGVKLPN